jgi:hypothetical protein
MSSQLVMISLLFFPDMCCAVPMYFACVQVGTLSQQLAYEQSIGHDLSPLFP